MEEKITDNQMFAEVSVSEIKGKAACCFTGHRVIPKTEEKEIVKRLKKAIEGLIKEGIQEFSAGGALGFDTLAAETVINIKKKNKDVRLKLVLPCRNQSSRWTKNNVDRYEKIKAAADEVIYTSENYFDGCMLTRNRYLVDNSDVCVCYLNYYGGGTGYTVNYAKKQQKRVINVADFI